MMGGQRRLSLKTRLGIAALTLTILISAASGGLVATQTAEGVGLVQALVGRSLGRWFLKHKPMERADRRAINQRRDAEKLEVDEEQLVRDYQFIRGWLDEGTYLQESFRLKWLKIGIEERAKRERQVVSFQTRRNIRNDFAVTVEGVLTISTGLNPKAVRFAGNLLRGEKPITAALDALVARSGEVVDPREQFRELRNTLSEVQEGLRSVRGAKGILVRTELARILREMGEPAITPEGAEEALDRVRQLGADVERAVAQAGAIKKDLFPQSPRIDRKRFANNAKWIMLNNAVQVLSTSTAGKAVLGGILRQVAERAEALLAAQGITLSDERLLEIAREIGSKYLAARVKDGEVLDASVVNTDEIVWRVVNEQLAEAGLPPLGAETPTPEPEEEVEPEPEEEEEAPPEDEVEPEPEEEEVPPEDEVEPEPEEEAPPQPGVTAVGKYTSFVHVTDKEDWPVLQNTITLTFDATGGLIEGDGHIESKRRPLGGVCKGAEPEPMYSYSAHYEGDCNSWMECGGTVQFDEEYLSYKVVCSEGDDLSPECPSAEYVCEPIQHSRSNATAKWQATLEDGVLRGFTYDGGHEEFELTVEG